MLPLLSSLFAFSGLAVLILEWYSICSVSFSHCISLIPANCGIISAFFGKMENHQKGLPILQPYHLIIDIRFKESKYCSVMSVCDVARIM